MAFFAQSQPNNATKFVTLNRAETHNAFRPYDLEVVPQLFAERREQLRKGAAPAQ